ncbi:hypothetical protein P154DRAFT_320378 [Amniculicola lignicola CBS 123094]|uniref:Uncharacterized protein n=1 Tax=Amniculicola lignicola CBS 123094 TaxID=1392246 RepID=A0A6A5WBE8_9PLEO|nr:hypothetical protein P154DRAFT_320378 [Amniculicola lignicola CBS 123094]
MNLDTTSSVSHSSIPSVQHNRRAFPQSPHHHHHHHHKHTCSFHNYALYCLHCISPPLHCAPSLLLFPSPPIPNNSSSNHSSNPEYNTPRSNSLSNPHPPPIPKSQPTPYRPPYFFRHKRPKTDRPA